MTRQERCAAEIATRRDQTESAIRSASNYPGRTGISATVAEISAYLRLPDRMTLVCVRELTESGRATVSGDVVTLTPACLKIDECREIVRKARYNPSAASRIDGHVVTVVSTHTVSGTRQPAYEVRHDMATGKTTVTGSPRK